MVIAVATAIASVCLLLRTLYAVLGIASGGYTWLCADGLAMGAVLAAVARTPLQPRKVVGHFMQRFWPRMYPAAGNFAVMAVQFSVAVTLTLALTYISRWYFEEGFLRLKNRGEVRSHSVQLHSDEAEAIAV